MTCEYFITTDPQIRNEDILMFVTVCVSYIKPAYNTLHSQPVTTEEWSARPINVSLATSHTCRRETD